jgi:hypothetical protein
MSLDDWADDLDDPAPDESDQDSETLPCPHCGAEVYEDAPRCPDCGAYISRSTNPWHGKPLWWVVLGLAGILAVLYLMAPF